MTEQAITALRRIHEDVSSIIDSLTDEEWAAPSGCEGWRVQDLVAHFTSNFKEIADPSPPVEGAPELKAEAAMEALVEPRRGWSPAEVAAEYHQHADTALAGLAAMQEEPIASTESPLADLGTHPLHMVANAFAFDHYCHLYIDLLQPNGPVARTVEPPTDDVLRPGIEWMLAGTPQMCSEALQAMTAPVTLELTGPGGGTTTFHPAAEGGIPTMTDGGGGAATVTSSAHDYVNWGTVRSSWRDHCTVTGDTAAAEAFLDNLNII